jgi:hypothetical protein
MRTCDLEYRPCDFSSAAATHTTESTKTMRVRHIPHTKETNCPVARGSDPLWTLPSHWGTRFVPYLTQRDYSRTEGKLLLLLTGRILQVYNDMRRCRYMLDGDDYMTPCSPVEVYRRFDFSACFLLGLFFDPKDGASRFLRNVSILPRVSHARREYSSTKTAMFRLFTVYVTTLSLCRYSALNEWMANNELKRIRKGAPQT